MESTDTAAAVAAAVAARSAKRRRVETAEEVPVVDAAVELRISIPEPAVTMLQVLLDDVQGTSTRYCFNGPLLLYGFYC